MKTKNKILIVVTNYINDALISARRWRYLAEYLLEHGYDITIISHDGKTQDLKLSINGISVLSMTGGNEECVNHGNVTEKLKRYKDKLFPLLAIYYRISEAKMKTDLKKRIRCSYTNGLLKELKGRHFDIVISSVYNMDAFITAKELRQILGIEKHICDIRDPLINPFFGNKAQQQQGIRYVKEIHQETDAIITVEELIKKEVRSLTKRSKKPVYIVPHAYQKYLDSSGKSNDFTGNKEKKDRKTILNMASVGTYYPENHNAMPLVSAIKELDKKKEICMETVKIDVVGRNSSLLKQCFTDSGVGCYVEDRKFVSHNEAVEIQKQADILLYLSSIDEVSEHQGVTGKFAEYLSLDKELLMMFDIRNHGERQMDYFRKMNVGLAVDTNDNGAVKLIEEWLKVKITEKDRGAISHKPNRKIVDRYSLSYVGGQIEKILQKTLD